MESGLVHQARTSLHQLVWPIYILDQGLNFGYLGQSRNVYRSRNRVLFLSGQASTYCFTFIICWGLQSGTIAIWSVSDSWVISQQTSDSSGISQQTSDLSGISRQTSHSSGISRPTSDSLEESLDQHLIPWKNLWTNISIGRKKSVYQHPSILELGLPTTWNEVCMYCMYICEKGLQEGRIMKKQNLLCIRRGRRVCMSLLSVHHHHHHQQWSDRSTSKEERNKESRISWSKADIDPDIEI